MDLGACAAVACGGGESGSERRFCFSLRFSELRFVAAMLIRGGGFPDYKRQKYEVYVLWSFGQALCLERAG